MAESVAEKRWLRIARGILERPTATLLEHAPAAYVRSFVERRSGLSISEDRYGNLIVKSPARSRSKAPPLVMMAHLDHPGFVVERVEGDVAHLEFRGGVRLPHAKKGARLSFFRVGRNAPIGKGRLLTASSRGGRRRGFLGSGTARITTGRAAAGDFTMWDYPGYSMKGRRIVSRCLDDLLGAAAALAVLDEMHRRRPRGAQVWGYFTRAEEVGFLGALAGIRAKALPRNARVLSLETSRALPHAPQGGGVIVRVGDARSLFDPRLMGVLHDVAKELAAEDSSFRFQRRLMDGGACEATPFCAAGWRSGGLALPLGNYHNMKGLDGGPKGIGPEHVVASDYFDEIRLLARLGEISGRLPELEKRTEAWMVESTAKACKMLAAAPLSSGGAGAGAGRRGRG